MSMAARAISSRAVSSISLAGMTRAMASGRGRGRRGAREGAADVGRKLRLDLRRDRLGHLPRAARTLLRRLARPEIDVRVGVVQPELHGDGVDERLEFLAERDRHRVVIVARLDA